MTVSSPDRDPKVGDRVDVEVTIQGHTVFQSLSGTILVVAPPDVEITAPFAGSALPLRIPIASLLPVGPDRWKATAKVKL